MLLCIEFQTKLGEFGAFTIVSWQFAQKLLPDFTLLLVVE